MVRRLVVVLAGVVLCPLPAPAGAMPKVANRCVAIPRVAGGPFHFKPSGLGTFLIAGRDGELLGGPRAEWLVDSRGRRGVRLVPRGGGRAISVRRLRRVRTCRRFPEAELGATGRPFRGPRRGPVRGFADPHMHLAAELRAGGRVIAGSSYDRFGIAEALGRDADVHGEDGGMDITGNLLRSGSPTGTHDTHGWPTFTGWPTFDTYTHHQIYYRWLQRAWLAGWRLIGAQIIEDAPLCEIEPSRSHSCDETETAELQVERLRGLEDYVDAQAGGRGRGWLRIVASPGEARRVIRRGKLAVFLAFESSNPFGCALRQGAAQCDRAGIDRGIERLGALGIRSMFLAHWVDNALAGAALEGGDKGSFIAAMQVSYTGAPFVTGPCPHPGQGEEPEGTGALTGPQCNAKGLTELGAYAVGRMMDRHMLIEVDHLSERAREQVLALAEARGYPLVSSHTGTGGKWDDSELRRLQAVGGFAAATLDDAVKLPDKVLALRRLGFANVGLATDIGGFSSLPAPDKEHPLTYPFLCQAGDVRLTRQRTGERTFDLNTDGVAHYGLLPDLLALTRQQPRGAEAVDDLFGSAEAYLRMWERAGA
jgi:microsomal dipeptidase-like Zn-dependent dipeptidase